ncbi:MAG: RNase H family protein [Vicinamibacterales bacterium]
MSETRTVVFCDGAAKGNPGPGGWGVVIATLDGTVIELGGRAAHTTNNRMELTAAIEALTAVASRPGPVAMHTDSTYVIKGISEWIWGWRQRGWKTAAGGDVLNRELWQALEAVVNARSPRRIDWHYVRGHSGIPGNERVDAIADGLARGEAIALYQGPLAAYPIAIFDLPDDTTVPKRSKPSAGAPARKAAAHSYLSLVDGTPMRHGTWAECEQRVKGRSGARFKKATSAEDERAILRGWQVDPGAL